MPFATAPDGVRIYFESTGSGRPVVLVPGAFGDLTLWQQQGVLQTLARERRVIALDLRGHGRSDKPHDPTFYGYAKNTDDVAAVLEAEGIDGADLFGQSLGGSVAVALLHRNNERLRSIAFSGVLVDVDRKVAGRFFLRRARLLREGRYAELLTKEAPLMSVNADAISAYVERLARSDTLAFAAEAEGHARFELQELPAEGPPTLALAGTHDAHSFRACEGLPLRLPYVRFKPLTDAGHFGGYSPEILLPPLRKFWATLGS